MFSIFETLKICKKNLNTKFSILVVFFLFKLQEYNLTSLNKNNVSLGSRVEAQQQNTKNTKQRKFESSSSKVGTQKQNTSITK